MTLAPAPSHPDQIILDAAQEYATLRDKLRAAENHDPALWAFTLPLSRTVLTVDAVTLDGLEVKLQIAEERCSDGQPAEVEMAEVFLSLRRSARTIAKRLNGGA